MMLSDRDVAVRLLALDENYFLDGADCFDHFDSVFDSWMVADHEPELCRQSACPRCMADDALERVPYARKMFMIKQPGDVSSREALNEIRDNLAARQVPLPLSRDESALIDEAIRRSGRMVDKGTFA